MDSNHENFIKADNHESSADVPKENGNTPLHLAAGSNNANDLMKLLEAGVDLNAQNEEGYTALHVAVKANAWTALQILLSHSATDPNIHARNGDTPLTVACRAKSKELVFKLIFSGADMNKTDKKLSRTVLHWAVINQWIDVVDILLLYKSNLDAQDIDGNAPLHFAAVNPDKEEIMKTLLVNGANPSIQNRNGLTPLHLTVEQKNRAGFLMLLQNAALDLNIAEHKFGCTPLIKAVHLGMEGMLNYLIAAGADIQAVDKHGMTALHWAANFRNNFSRVGEFNVLSADLTARRVNCVKTLLNAGADVNALDKCNGNTPLHTAVETGALAVFRVLLEHPNINLNVHRVMDDGTPLIIAVRLGLEEMFTQLITAGADVNATDYNGKTVLHSAAYIKYTGEPRSKLEVNFVPDDFTARRANAAKKLLSNGADANMVDKLDGNTPLHTAVESKTWSVFQVLLEHPNVDLNVRREIDGKTPLMLLVDFDFSEEVAFHALIKAGADINLQDDEGKTLLHYSVKIEDTTDMIHLLNNNANVDIQDAKGQTPLLIAARRGNFEACKELLNTYYADRDITDNRGRLPRDVAIERNYDDIVTLLISNMPAA